MLTQTPKTAPLPRPIGSIANAMAELNALALAIGCDLQATRLRTGLETFTHDQLARCILAKMERDLRTRLLPYGAENRWRVLAIWERNAMCKKAATQVLAMPAAELFERAKAYIERDAIEAAE